MGKQKSYKMNEKKTDAEVLLGYYMFKKWGNGNAYARRIRGYMDLKAYVKKDFYKYTESMYLKPNAKKWYYSLNVAYDPKGEVQGEWERVLESAGRYDLEDALYMVKSTKDNMINYYNDAGKVGAYIYRRVINDIKSRMVDEKGLMKDGYYIQKKLDDL
ncbi:MAG: hypothetical protein ACTSRI_16070 [Promethearchaeota archaeon]